MFSGNDVLAGLRALKNLLRKAHPYSREQGVKYFLKTGDFTTAMKYFNSLKPKNIKKFSTVRYTFSICLYDADIGIQS